MNRTSLALLALAVGCAQYTTGAMQKDYRQLQTDLAAATADPWAEVCAPRELALAITHRDFAEIEFKEGDPRTATEHLAIANENILIALQRAELCRPKDRDQDGVWDDLDQCPDVPEDVDGEDDEDGCPDFDKDGDGISDDVDRCPDTPEDKDNYQDEDGCPEVDNDGDGLIDTSDQCPMDPEDRDNWLDGDGCPEPDNDGDGLLDGVDKCPNEPEDKNGIEDEDGCPESDRDNDGFKDTVDKCPDEPETKNEYLDDDGCPDTKPQNVKITAEKIEISQTIYFEVNKTIIKPVSFGILNEVAQVLKDYPSLTIRIEGHTDSDGSDAYNLSLSHGRAESVRAYLIEQGIDGKRLTAEGYGETRPIDTNRTSAGKAKNRRVEFMITGGMGNNK